ncbi:MAG: HAD-IIIA family hydrolase [Lentisphaeria bacterium]|nr:HAD-IIIA family hydrolase [Lentisphaeria bacterium]
MNLPGKASRIRIVVLDVDGVLTDARTGYGCGEEEIKFFNVRDGLGIKLLQAAGLRVGILSGRSSAANRRRASELALDFVLETRDDKGAALERLLRELGAEGNACCYVGDDLIDLPAMRRAGLAVAVADAAEEVRARAHFTTRARGGEGAVREVAEWLLRQQGAWENVVARYVG